MQDGGSDSLSNETFTTNEGTTSLIAPATITAVTNTDTAVILQANTDITINSAIISSAPGGTGGALTFQAGRSIIVNASVISDNGNISFSANDPNAVSGDRLAGTAVFSNNSIIDAGTANVSITMNTGTAGASGSIETGHVNAANLTVVQDGPTGGATAGAIDLGETNLTGNLSISANTATNVTNTLGTSGEAGEVIVRGTATIRVGTGNVTINGPDTDFSIIGLTADNVLLNNAGAVQFTTTNVSGTLTETTVGPIASTGSVQVAGAASFAADSGGFGIADPYINLTNSGNHFGGGLTLSVPSTGTTGTGGYATIVDSGAIGITTSNTATFLQVQAGGAITAGPVTAGTSVTLTTTNSTVTTSSLGAEDLYVTVNGATGGAVTLGTSTISQDLTVSTTGAISDTGVTSVSRQTTLTAGAANNVTLGNAGADSFNYMRIVSADNVSLITANGVDFGNWNAAGGWTSTISGNLGITSGGNIQQVGQGNTGGYSAISVGGATTFTANGTSQIQLLLGSTNPFNSSGQANLFTGGVTLATASGNNSTGFNIVEIRDTNPAAVVLAGLTSVGTLNDVYLEYNSAPAITLPGMTVTGNLYVYGPSVANTATTPANIITQTGNIVVNGNTIMAAASTGDILLNYAGNDFAVFGIANTGARNLTIVNDGAIELYAPGYNESITGNLSINTNNTGAISDAGNAWSVSGTAAINAGAANNINFTQNDTWGGAVSLTGDNVTFNPNTSLLLGNSSIAGTLSISSRNYGYSLTQVPGSSVVMGNTADTTTLNNFSGGITLAQPNNIFGPLAIGNAGAISIAENSAISQASAWSDYSNGVDAVTLSTTNSQAITLTQPSAYMGNLTITQANAAASSPGAVTVTSTADTAGITQGSGAANAWTTYGTTTLNSGAYSIDLNNPNNVLGPLQVSGATGSYLSVPSSVTLYAKGTAATTAITDVGGTGAWNVGSSGTAGSGVVKLIAYDTTGTVAGGGNIVLDNSGNVMGNLYLKATDATITENASITDGTLTSWDAAGDTGWAVSGALDLIVNNPTGKTITLANTTNVIAPIGITTTGTGTLTSVLITDNAAGGIAQSSIWNIGTAPITLNATSHAINLSGYGNVLGPISISDANGTPTSVSITENNPLGITQGATAWSLTGVPVTLDSQNNYPITLTDTGNVMGNLTLTGGAVSITENAPITQATTAPTTAGGAWTTTSLTLDVSASAGSGITLENTGNSLGPISITGTPNVVNINENAPITQGAAWVLPTVPVTLNSTTGYDTTLSEAGNQLGALTITAKDATVTEDGTAGITQGAAWDVPDTTTLDAGSANPIALNTVASTFGTVGITQASNASITAAGPVNFATSTVSGTLTVTAGGAITQSGAITAPQLDLIGSGTASATLTNTGNSVGTLAAGISDGNLNLTNSGDLAVGLVGGTIGIDVGTANITLTSVNGTVTGLSSVNPGSGSLTVSTGTALSLPQLSIAGAQTYTAGGAGITLTTNLTSTAAGAITFNSPVTLGSDLTVQSTNSPIDFNSTLDGANYQVNVNAGSGLATFVGAVSALGRTTSASPAMTLSSGGAAFDTTVSANNGLAITGPVTFSDTVTLGDGEAASVFSGLVTLGKAGGMNLSGYNGMSFNDGVLLENGPATIDSNNSPLTFQTAGNVSGPFGLTLDSGTAALNGLNFIGTSVPGENLTSLTVIALNPTVPSIGITIAGPQTYTATGSSDITLQGNVTSTAAGAITFNSPVSIGSSLTVSTVNSPVVFASTLDGNSNVSATSNLTVNPGTSTATFTGAVGQVTPLGNGTGAALVLDGSGATTFDSTVQTRSGITAAGPVTFDGNVTMADGDTGSTFTGLVTSGGSSGNTLSGYGGIVFDGGLAVAGGPVSVISNGSTISFGGAVGGAENLTLNALAGGTGTVTGLNEIGPSSTLTALTVTGETLSLPSSGLAVAGPMTFTAPGGITVNGDVGSSANPASGAITFVSPVTLATGPVLISNANAPVLFESTIDGAEPLAINAGTGTVTFDGAVGSATALSSLTVLGGPVTIDTPNVTTTGAQTYGAPVTLAVNSTLNGDDVQFQGALSGPYALTVGDSGTTTFGGAVDLASLLATASGGIDVHTPTMTTTGAQTYDGAVTLGADATLTGAGITFDGTVNGAYALTASAISGGTLSLDGIVGGLTPLSSLTAGGNAITASGATTSGAQSYTANNVSLGGNYTTSGGAVTVTGPTTLSGNVDVATDNGNITFAGPTTTVNGAYSLTLTAGNGNVVLGAAVGGQTALTAFNASGFDLTLPDITTVGDLNQSYTALDNITLSQSRTLDAPVSFTADSDGNGQGSFILDNGVSLTVANNNLSITAADISLGTSSTLSSGTGIMTIAATDGRNIYLGGPNGPIAGQMTITGAELSLMSTSGGLNLDTTGTGSIYVNGITAAQSANVTGALSLNAQGSGSINFVSSPSTFHAITADAPGGLTNVGVDLTAANAPMAFMTPVSVSGASTLSSGGGNITFEGTLAVANNLTLDTGNGTLAFDGPVGSTQTLTLNLGGGSVSGLGELQDTLTGLTVNATSGIVLPAFTINGPQVYNTATAMVTGNLGGIGITFNTPVTTPTNPSGVPITLNAGIGTLTFASSAQFNGTNMTLTGDTMSFGGPITGSGNLVIQPYTGSVNVSVGGSGSAGGLDLSTAQLADLPIGTLASLTIGSATGIGTLDVAGPLNLPSTPLTLNGGGGITQSGGSITSGPLTLYAAGNPITLTNGTNAFGAVAINGTPSAVSLTNTLDIDQQGTAGWALGNAPVTLNAGTHNITLNNAGNTFGTLVLNGDNAQVTEASSAEIGASTLTGNLTLASAGAIDFSGALAATGNVTLTSTGEVTQSAPLTIGGNLSVTTTVNAGDVTLSNAGDTVMGNTQVGGNYTLASAGSVSQAAGTSYQVAGTLAISGTNIVLGGAGNIAGGTSLSGSTSNTDVIDQSGVITLTNMNYTGNLTVISESASRSISSAPVTGDAILLNNAGNAITGSISVSASPPIVTTSGSEVQTGINQAANTSVSVSGVASFTAQASSVANSGIINLTNTGNSFGTLVLSGSTVEVLNAASGPTTIASALATNSLALETTGPVTQTGAISTPSLTIASAGSVTLDNPANQVSALSVTSTGSTISFVNGGDLSIAGISGDASGSAVSVTAGGSGSLSQTGAIQNASTLSVNAGGSIVLTNTGNSIAVLNTSTAGTGFQLYNDGALGVSGVVSTTAGDLSVRTTGNLTLGTAGQLEALAGNVVASTEGAGNFINDSAAESSALVVGSGDRWLVYSDTPDLIAGAHTVKGGLTSSFRYYDATYSTYAPGSVTQSGNGFIYDYATPALTVTATVVGTPTQVYGSNPTATLGYTVSGFVDSEDNAGNVISGGTAAYSTVLASTMNAGVYNITYTGGLTSSNYTLSPAAAGATYTVTPAVLTYDAVSASRAYGAANPAFTGTVSGFVLGQSASVLSGTATWTSPATASSNAGQYAIDGNGYTAGNNYTFAQAAGNATALTITPAGLTITANGESTTYNGTAFSGGNGVTYSGFVNGQTYSDLGGALTYGGSSQGARNAGSYTITPGGLTDGNYAISYVGGTLTIGKANLTLTTANVTKTYDGALDASAAAVATDGTQIFGGDAASGGTFAFTNANAGTADKTVTVSGVTVNDGNGGNNYNVSYVANTTSTIDPAAITVSTSNVTKTYDGTVAANGTATVVSGTLYHNVSNGGALDTVSGGTFAFTNANAGTGDKTVTAGGVTVNDGNGGGNYAVTYVDNTTSTINPAALTFVGTVADKTYDATTTATLSGYTLTGFIGDQTVDAAAGAANFSDPNAGVNKTVTISGITLANGTNGGLASNYTVNPTATATAAIDPKVLTVSATVENKVYDGTTNATLQSYGLSGFVGNQTVTGVGGAAAFANKNVGNDKPVTIAGIVLVNGTNGGLASNYTVSPNASSDADITPATLQVAGVVALNKVYDGTTTANLDTQSAVITGVITGDNVQVGTITGNFLSKNVGNNLPITTSGFVLTGTDAMDYTLVQPTGLTASITPRPLTVTATGSGKVYDGSTSATVALSDNAIAGDELTVTSTNAFLDPNVGTGKYISVSNITIGGADAEDYVANSSTSAYANITPATLTVSATGVNKVYDGNTAATVTLTDHPLVGGVVDVSYSSASFAGKNVGNNQAVTVNGITLSGADAEDYSVNSNVTTTADITPATLTVGAIGGSKAYNATTVAPVTLTDNVYPGDQVVLTLGSSNFASPSVGTGKVITVGGIEIAGGADASDYVLGNTTATTTGTILAAGESVPAQNTWLLPPAPPQPLKPSDTTPPASTLDLTLPSNFGSRTGSADSQAVVNDQVGANTQASANDQPGAGRQTGVSGTADAVAGAQLTGLITVSLVESATTEHSGLVSVSVPRSLIASGAGFSFALPAEIREAAQTGGVRVTLNTGKRLPAWLQYIPKTQTLVASATPTGALPMELMARTRTMSWIVEVKEDGER